MDEDLEQAEMGSHPYGEAQASQGWLASEETAREEEEKKKEEERGEKVLTVTKRYIINPTILMSLVTHKVLLQCREFEKCETSFQIGDEVISKRCDGGSKLYCLPCGKRLNLI